MKATNFSSVKTLKKLFKVSTFMVLSAVGSNALAQTTCYFDYWSNWICKDSRSNYQTTTQRDYWGNDVTTDNYGNTMTCHWDYWGNYVCN